MSSLELSVRLVRSFYDLPCNLDPVTSEGRQSTRHPRQFEHRGTSLRWVRDLNPPSDRPGKTLSDESPCIPSGFTLPRIKEATGAMDAWESAKARRLGVEILAISPGLTCVGAL